MGRRQAARGDDGQHLAALQRAELAAQAGLGVGRDHRHRSHDADGGEHREDADGAERRTPTKPLAQPRRSGDADHVRDAEPEQNPGDCGKPVTARAEVSRLRRLLPDSIVTEPYRLDVGVRSDLDTVRELLRVGRAADGVARYPGAVLPRSEAPGVVELRHELDGWMRRAVMAGEDVGALWAWLSGPSGADDALAWKRFVANIPHGDGRRGLAAARLERLRGVFGPTGSDDERALAAA